MQRGAVPDPPAESLVPEPWLVGATVIAEIDISDPSALELIRTQEVEGRYESARLIDGTARVVVVSTARTSDDTDDDGGADDWSD